MKAFFTKIKNWFINHRPSKRRLIQVYAALLYNANLKGFVTGKIYTGNTKYACVPGLNCYSCPGAVGACPLGALQNAMSSSDKTAPYYVIGILALFCILLGRTICGFLCPVGLGQELLYKIKTPKVKKNRVTRILSYFKYVLLVVMVIILPILLGSPTFCKYICPAGTLGGGVSLLAHPENADFFAMLSGLFTWKFALLVAMIVASIFIYRFFCRFFCPLGALYGLFNRIALIGVRLDKSKCTDCGLCVDHCKMDINHVGDQECIECGECIAVCPTQAITWKGSKIFLHPSAVSKKEEAPALNALLQAGTTAPVAGTAPEMDTAPAPAQDTAEVKATVEAATESANNEISATANEPLPTVTDKIRRRNKILEIAAWSVATLFLAFVLIFYNFIDKSAAIIPYQIGDECPDFTVRTYDGTEDGGEFTLSDYKGEKVVVLNFWYTSCEPCKEEIPHFNTFQETYANDVVVISLHQSNPELGYDGVQEFLNEKGWNEYAMLFGQDMDYIVNDIVKTSTTLYSALNGKQAWPMTVVVDKDGKITEIRQGKMPYEELVQKITPLF